MEETWGNGHYSCYGCKHEASKDAFSCKRCFTYTPLMKPYYQNWTKNDTENGEGIPIIHGKAELELHDKEIRAKAIEEFVAKIKYKAENKWVYDLCEDDDNQYFMDEINEIATELKGE